MMNEEDNNKKLITLCGPTSSGKTSLAVKIAGEFNCEIISADSRQVYRGMDIGTGKDLDEYDNAGRSIPYHCIDIAEPDELYSLFDYMNDFERAFLEINSRQVIPLLSGGTGLYVEAALKRYKIPNVPEDETLRENLMLKDAETLTKELYSLSRDIYSQTDLSSKKRIIRSIEVARYSLNHEIKYSCEKSIHIEPLILALVWPREELLSRIDERLRERLDQGLVQEVRGLMAEGVSENRLDSFGMEYRHVVRFITGKLSYDEMVESLKNELHRLSKRQMTWFRGMEKRGLKLHWIERADYDKACMLIEKFL